MSGKTVIEEDGTIKSFKDWIKADGSTDFLPEKERYHIYGQHVCPFFHRTAIGRVLKGLEDVISMDNLDYVNEKDKGWKFSPEKEGCDADSINGYEYLREAYEASAKKLGASGFSGSVVVPTLYDKKLGRVVSNESADILRMFNEEFNEFCTNKELDLFPQALRPEIEKVEGWVLGAIGYGVYGPGWAKTQEDYDAAIEKVYSALDKAEEMLSKKRYLVGEQMTEADIWLFVILIRFDPVYFIMRCCKKRISDYPALWAYIRDIYQTGNIKSTVVFDHIMKSYFLSHILKPWNPYGIVPSLPELNYDEPSNRENM
ncbi:glutathionyl-hydroquinone reductase YqjG-like [Watersipora subatra]|uniref:glutathionyl-hydroquinone reductase YqjG-like n=1 Tax=Watersipora subatra TaxID=2589382 RepID=UPI00355C53F8